MILRCCRNILGESVSNDRIYPVIAYEIDKENDSRMYQIVDDCRSLSWKNKDDFEVISDILSDYTKVCDENAKMKFVYNSLLENDFFVNYYMENEDSVIANAQLEKSLIIILSSELTAEELESNLRLVGYRDENAELILKSFFKNANRQEVIDLSNCLYDKINELNCNIVDIIVQNLSCYKTPEVERLFIELYMDESLCKNETCDIISEYLEI